MMRLRCLAALLQLLPACVAPEEVDELDDFEEDDSPLGSTSLTAAGRPPLPSVALDGKQWPIDELEVCWVDPAAGDATRRQWVREAIEGSWHAVTRLRFVGWGDCDDADDPEITISVTDDGAWSHLGTNSLTEFPSMNLNFEYDDWNDDRCDSDSTADNGKTVRRNCIENNAMHEFGHAIALKHEQAHPQSTCDEDEELPANGVPLYDYDPDSIMNYCNDERWEDPLLSATDIQGALTIYPSAVSLYRSADFRGTRQIVGPGTYVSTTGELGTVGDNAISSIVISPGHEVRVCTNSAGTDGCSTLTSSRRTLSATLDNQISYVSVRPRAWVFAQSNLRGNNQRFAVGKALANAGGLSTLGNDTASSIVMPHGLKARLCQHEGTGSGGGLCSTFFGGKPFDQILDINIPDSLDNRTSYVEVSPYVIAYDDADLRGEGLFFEIGVHRASTSFWFSDDDVESFTVGPGLEVRACESEGASGNGAGVCRVFGESTTFVGADLVDRISYIEVRTLVFELPPLDPFPGIPALP